MCADCDNKPLCGSMLQTIHTFENINHNYISHLIYHITKNSKLRKKINIKKIKHSKKLS